VLPESLGRPVLRDVFTGDSIPIGRTDEGAILDAASVFAGFPIALLVSSSLGG
jgi:hypothetical protein